MLQYQYRWLLHGERVFPIFSNRRHGKKSRSKWAREKEQREREQEILSCSHITTLFMLLQYIQHTNVDKTIVPLNATRET